MRIPFARGLTARVVDYWIRARSSYWFLPSLMTVGAILLALGLVAVDRAKGDWVSGLWLIVASQPDGARQLLATVAGSMITVAGVTFSMTLLMVSFASAQLGPRLVPRFLRDRGNQVVLGMFIATFIYCLIVLRTVRSAEEAGASGSVAFVPHLATLAGVLLALLSVAVLIYFLHHVPMRINASSVIGLLGNELLLRLEREFPRADEGGAGLRWPDESGDGAEIRLEEAGCYLRIVDYDGLVDLAKRTDRRLTTLVAPGAFCVPDAPIVRIHGGPVNDACRRELRGLFSWGGDRTPDQDILFLVDQLAEIAGKALSTGINDQFTALLCVDQMERVLCAAAKHREPDRVRGADGVPRVLITRVSLPEVADRFLMPLRQFARGDLLMTDRLLAMLASSLAHHTEGSPMHDRLRHHRDALFADAAAALPAASEREWLEQRETERRATKLSNAEPSGVHARPGSSGSGLQK
jgi:uncharacterized membrane protein